ncbi:exonuclease, partial [Candidatus Poribacteria bacterium]|nr:exonuclease [Candidatus Poribacteria bacterium]
SEYSSGFDVLVTFNGKTFDAPFIADRMIYHRKRFRWKQTHVDILHHSRRQWKEELPDCKLQTLESYICGRKREGDVPGSLVPEVYKEFVKRGDTRLLAEVFHHNALDLITLTELTVILLS